MSAFDESPIFDPQASFDKEVTVTWSNSYSISGRQSEYVAAMDMLAARRVAALPLITHRYPLVELRAAFAVANDKHRSHAMKVIVQP